MKTIHYIIAVLIISLAQLCDTKLQIALTGIGIIGLISAVEITISSRLNEIKNSLNTPEEND